MHRAAIAVSVCIIVIVAAWWKWKCHNTACAVEDQGTWHVHHIFPKDDALVAAINYVGVNDIRSFSLEMIEITDQKGRACPFLPVSVFVGKGGIYVELAARPLDEVSSRVTVRTRFRVNAVRVHATVSFRRRGAEERELVNHAIIWTQVHDAERLEIEVVGHEGPATAVDG